MMKHYSRYTFLAVSALFGLSVATGAGADAGKLTESCVGCHGKGGANTEAAIPNIGGYSTAYMTDALKLYKTKARPCPETKIPGGAKKGTKSDMCQAVKDLSDADIKEIAESFAEQKFVRTPQKFDAALAKKGKELHDRLCEKCHSEGGSVASDDQGILAGQKTAYLEEQFKFFNEGKRPISKKMKPKMEELDKAGIQAVLNYYASFK
ncbi:c-type cytochrome [Sulfuricella denitrificans]|nr:c-type cytochrome [Sulfuricella denitrificans]